MRKFLIIAVLLAILTSCADSKNFNINGKDVEVEPYGWMNPEEENDSIKYRMSTGNIVWSVILSETIIVPIVLTGNSLYEPVGKK